MSEERELIGWREADRQLRRLAARRAALDAEEARWLLIARRENVHERFGYGSFLEYVERVLGYRSRTAVERLRVADALEELPATREALSMGELSYSAVREVTRVATAETEAEWLEAVEGKTMRQIEALVAGREPGDRPGDPQDPALELRSLHLELAPDVYAMFLEARRTIEQETGEKLDDSGVMAALCERACRSAASDRAPYQIALTVCAVCDRATQDAAGQEIAVDPGVLERARCDAEHVGSLGADAPERLKTDIPPATRRLVWLRDHGRCTVPGCRASRHLEIHHIRSREDGGDHSLHNLTLLCGAHHRARHDGRLSITGHAPDLLEFRHRDGRRYGADFFAEVRAALEVRGIDRPAALTAIDQVRAHVGADARLEDVIHACLARCSSH